MNRVACKLATTLGIACYNNPKTQWQNTHNNAGTLNMRIHIVNAHIICIFQRSFLEVAIACITSDSQYTRYIQMKCKYAMHATDGNLDFNLSWCVLRSLECACSWVAKYCKSKHSNGQHEKHSKTHTIASLRAWNGVCIICTWIYEHI